MNEREEDAYHIIKKNNIDGPTSLASFMGIKKQWASVLIKNLKKQNLIVFEPARWRIK